MAVVYDSTTARKIIERCYVELLCRNPDKKGLEQYLWFFETGHMNEDTLRKDIENSYECKQRHWFDDECQRIMRSK